MTRIDAAHETRINAAHETRINADCADCLETTVPLNACELEIDLFCRGLRIPETVSLEGSRAISHSRAGLASGLEVAIPAHSRVKRDVWLNAPVVEPFAKASPYELEGAPDAGYRIRDGRTDARYDVRLPKAPAWYRRLTSRDVPMSRIGLLQGTCLAVYVDPVCAFWKTTPALSCRFCSTGAGDGTPARRVDDVVETCWVAKEQSGATFVQLNGGFMARGAEFVEPFVRAIKQDVGLLVGVQLTPEHNLRHYDPLIDLGVDQFSFCVELVDADWFARVCPGKARVFGQALYFKAIEYCASRLPRGAVFGELIAGLEPAANTIEGIERIVSAGATPTVSIFRPTAGSDLESWPPPSYDEMRGVAAALYDACRRHHIPIGVAPNVELSLVVSPEDAALLAPRTPAFYAYETWRRGLRVAARPVFSSRLRARPRRKSVADSGEFGTRIPG